MITAADLTSFWAWIALSKQKIRKIQPLSKQGAGRVVGTNWKEAMEELDLGTEQRFLGKRF